MTKHRFVILTVACVMSQGCVQEVPPASWVSQIEEAGRRAPMGEPVVVSLEGITEHSLIVVVPPDGLDIDRIPDRFREAFRRAELGARAQPRLVIARSDALSSATIAIVANRQLQVEKRPGDQVHVTVRRRADGGELASIR
jgi:hypothetical protein